MNITELVGRAHDMAEFGEGLFDDTLGAGNVPQTAQKGEEGAAGKAGGLNDTE